MTKRTFYGKIENHVMSKNLRELDYFVEWIAKDGFYKISIEPTGNTLSGKQRRYFFGVIMATIMKELRLSQDDKDTLYDFLKEFVGGLTYTKRNPFTKRMETRLVSITKLEPPEAELFFEKCRAYAADPIDGWDIQIPLPNEYNHNEITKLEEINDD